MSAILPDLTDVQRAAIIDELIQLTNASYEAINKLDLENAYTYFSPRTTAVINGMIVKSWEEHKLQGKAFLASLREANYVIEELKVDVITRDVAIVIGRYSFTAIDTVGNEANAMPAWSWVFARQDGEWKIIHTHVSEQGGQYGPYAK